MKLLLLIIWLYSINLYSQEFPKVEDFQIKGFENVNFKNVLLNPKSSIDNFYAITDDGRIYDIKNMGHAPTVNLIFQIEGDISEAITYDSLHYLSLSTNINTYLIRTKDFIAIDTLYSEEGFQINDFQIYNNTISMIVNSGSISKVISRGVDATQWTTFEVPEFGFNRLATLYDNYYLYKYLNDDTNILKYTGEFNKWENIEYTYQDLQSFTDIITKDTIMFALGNFISSGRVILLDKSLSQPSGQFWTFGAPGKNTTYYDIAFDNDYEFLQNTIDNYQVGRFDNSIDSSGAYFFKAVYFGSNGYQNRKTYKSSYALRKIISNDLNQHKEFVAVGHNGFVLLINRGLSDIKTQKAEENSISLYPNPAIKTDEITIESKDLIKSITVSDIKGKVLFSTSSLNRYNYRLSILEFPSTTYFVSIETDKDIISKIFNVVR